MKTFAAVMNPIAARALRARSIQPPEPPVRVGKSGIIAPNVPGSAASVKPEIDALVLFRKHTLNLQGISA
jgi:hypothetical protein